MINKIEQFWHSLSDNDKIWIKRAVYVTWISMCFAFGYAISPFVPS